MELGEGSLPLNQKVTHESRRIHHQYEDNQHVTVYQERIIIIGHVLGLVGVVNNISKPQCVIFA